MGRRIDSDWKHFRDIIQGALHKRLKHLIKTGEIYRLKGKKYIPVKLPRSPFLIFNTEIMMKVLVVVQENLAMLSEKTMKNRDSKLGRKKLKVLLSMLISIS